MPLEIRATVMIAHTVGPRYREIKACLASNSVIVEHAAIKLQCF